MTLHTKDSILFNDAPGASLTPTGRASRYPGMPAGIQLFSQWNVHYHPFIAERDIPVDATSWTITVTGTTPAASLSDDLAPPHLILTNSAADNDSWEGQYTDADSAGEYIDPTGQDFYFETNIRLSDENDDDDTVEQVDWFVGLCVTDTTVIDGATDFIGFVKRDVSADATGSIDFVSADAGGTSGALVDGSQNATGWVALNPASATTNTQAGHREERIMGPNEWLHLAFYCDVSEAAAHVYVNHAHEGSFDLTGQVPDQNLCVSIAVQNGEAVAKVLEMEHFLVAQKLDNA